MIGRLLSGRIAQLVRALASHARGPVFESPCDHLEARQAAGFFCSYTRHTHSDSTLDSHGAIAMYTRSTNILRTEAKYASSEQTTQV